jgi:chorismate mutase
LEQNAKLEKLRRKIDVIDVSLVKIISKRMRLVKRVGKLKAREGIESLDPKRWDKVLARVKTIAKETGEISEQMIEDIWNRIHTEAVALEDGLKKKGVGNA